MAYQVLARKYRPQSFSDVIGQEHVTRTLKSAIEHGRIAHGYIFSGHRGIGKTTIARILAKALNCHGADGQATGPQSEPCGTCDSCTEIRDGSSVDVIEIDAATNRGIDEIRELRDAARYRPARDRFKIYILDEAHQITDAAFNALLKTLEEPPPHIIFMMATTQPEDIPQTIRSRCQHFSFHAVKFDDIVGQLRSIAQQEAIDAEDDAISMVAEAGDGSMRDALSIMDQAIASADYSGGKTTLTAEQIRGLVGAVPSEVLERLMESVSHGSAVEVLTLIDRLMTEGQSPTHFARQFVRYLRNVVVAKVAGADSEVLQISSDERGRVGRTAALFTEEDVTRYMNIMLRTFDELGYKQEQRFHLELGVLKLVHAQRLLPMERLLSSQLLPTSSGGAAPTGRPSTPGTAAAASGARQTASPRQAGASPFERDTASKSGPSSPGTTSSGVNPFASPRSAAPVDPTRKGPKMETSSAFAVTTASPFASASTAATAVAIAEQPVIAAEVAASVADEAATSAVDCDMLRIAVIAALNSNGQSSLSDVLAEGEWAMTENVVHVRVAQSAGALKVILTPEVMRLANQALAKASGTARAPKFEVLPGLAEAVKRANENLPSAPAGSAKQRAAEDPLVQYFQKKFKAEIRTIVDQRKG